MGLENVIFNEPSAASKKADEVIAGRFETIYEFESYLAENNWPAEIILCPQDFLILWQHHSLMARKYPLQVGPTVVKCKTGRSFDISNQRIFQ